MKLAIRHFPDRKKPVIVLEQGNQALILGYLTDSRRERWLREALDLEKEQNIAFEFYCPWELEQITER